MAGMADGRVVGLSAVAAVAIALLLAGVADADCFDYCYKNCIANDRSMADYCNYACDKTCEPGAPLRPLVASGGDMGCQLSCARTSCTRLRAGGKAVQACFGQCYDGCKTKTLPRPLRAGVPTALGPVSEADADDAVRRASRTENPSHVKHEAVLPALKPDKDNALHPASEPEDASVRPTSEPKDDAVRPMSEHRTASEPDPDDGVRPACRLDCDFHDEQGAIHPASEPDKDDAVRPAWGPVLPSSEPHKDDAVRWPFHHHDEDGVRPARWPADGPRGANPGPEIHVPPPAPVV